MTLPELRDVDALIFEKYLGIPAKEGFTRHTLAGSTEPMWVAKNGAVFTCPMYSSVMADTQLVIDRWEGDFTIHRLNGQWYVTLLPSSVSSFGEWQMWGPTLPEAFCLAVLKTVG